MSQVKYKNYRVRVELDDCAQSMGWDGDEPLDESRDWTACVLFFEGQCDACESWHDIDCIGGVWTSDDADGREHIKDTLNYYFDLEEHGVTRDTVECVGF